MLDQLKEYFSWAYKRFEWGYKFGGSGVQLFNFVGILTLLIRGINNEISRWILVPLFLLLGLIGCVSIGYFMFDLLKLKTKFAEQEGNRDDYWTHKLSPIQQKMLLVYLEAIDNKEKLNELKEKVKSGKL
jgi:hypothetical protein